MSRLVLVAHGAGSTPDVALRLLAPALPRSVELVAIDARGHIDDLVSRLSDAATGHEVVLAAGISLGAHAVALWASLGASPHAILLALPAWTGIPTDVAAMTAHSARAVADRGSAAMLVEMALDPALRDDWVLDEVTRGWAGYTDSDLAHALHSAAVSPAPTLEDLARITVATAGVALDDDPLHPADVARAWAGSIRGAALELVPRYEPASDRGALGRAGLRGLKWASGSR